jgi:hypothetical protein
MAANYENDDVINEPDGELEGDGATGDLERVIPFCSYALSLQFNPFVLYKPNPSLLRFPMKETYNFMDVPVSGGPSRAGTRNTFVCIDPKRST